MTSNKCSIRSGRSVLHWLPMIAGILTLALVVPAQPSHAFTFGTPEDGLNGSLDTTVTYSLMYRLDDYDQGLIDDNPSNVNTDDGTKNFGKKGVVSNRAHILSDLSIKYDTLDTTYGFFTRAFAFRDWSIHNSTNDHDSPLTNNNNAMFGGSLTNTNKFTNSLDDEIGQDADILDAFVYGDWMKQTDHSLSVKLGWHVINWGESTFILSGIVSAINPLDASKAVIPGSEIKELLLPLPAVSAGFSLTPNLNISGYYQFAWDHLTAPAAGSMFSESDIIGPGSETALLPLPVPASANRNSDIDPGDDGQWGVALNWYSEALNSTDFGLYYVNYHRKLPDLAFTTWGGTVDPALTGVLAGGFGTDCATLLAAGNPANPLTQACVADSIGYSHKYFDDVQLVAFSWNTVLPVTDTAFSGEIAYHHDVPVQTTSLEAGLGQTLMASFLAPPGTVTDLSTREDIVTAQATFNQVIRLPKLADDISFLTEVGMVQTPDLEDGEFFFGPSANSGDKTSWGYKSQLTLTYFDALGKYISKASGTDISLIFNWSHDVEGNSPFPGASFRDNRKSFGSTIKAVWNRQLETALSYNNFFGSGNPFDDRDNISWTLKYLF